MTDAPMKATVVYLVRTETSDGVFREFVLRNGMNMRLAQSGEQGRLPVSADLAAGAVEDYPEHLQIEKE